MLSEFAQAAKACLIVDEMGRAAKTLVKDFDVGMMKFSHNFEFVACRSLYELFIEVDLKSGEILG